MVMVMVMVIVTVTVTVIVNLICILCLFGALFIQSHTGVCEKQLLD